MWGHQTSSSPGNENERFQGFPGQLGRESVLLEQAEEVERVRWGDGNISAFGFKAFVYLWEASF